MILSIDEAGDYIEKTVPKYALISINGTILKATMEENALIKIYPVVTEILKDLPVGSMYLKPPVVICRVTQNVLVILLTQAQEAVVGRMLEAFLKDYSPYLAKMYATLPKSLKDLIKFSIFSTARQAGPEPIAWLNNGHPLTEESIFKYSLSSMMVLMNEVQGAHQRILNFHPFISDRFLGLIYLFQIPLKLARGSAFDAALMLMANYDDRAIIYQFHRPLERIFSITADELVKKFQGIFDSDIHRQVRSSERDEFTTLLNKHHTRMQTIPLGFKGAADVRQDMLESIKDLTKSI